MGLRFSEPDTEIYFNHYDPDDDAANETIGLLADAGCNASGYRVNVASPSDVDAFFKKIVDEAGRIDILVNNAGITMDAVLVRMKEAAWDRVIDINLKGGFSLHAGCGQGNDETAIRVYYQYCIRGRSYGKRGPGELRRLQGRTDRIDKDCGKGTRFTRDSGQCHSSRFHRH